MDETAVNGMFLAVVKVKYIPRSLLRPYLFLSAATESFPVRQFKTTIRLGITKRSFLSPFIDETEHVLPAMAGGNSVAMKTKARIMKKVFTASTEIDCLFNSLYSTSKAFFCFSRSSLAFLRSYKTRIP